MCKKGFCIICRKDEQEMSDEHVIPEAIGGYYHIYSVCKTCNSRLGDHIDKLLLNHWFIKASRYEKGLKGYSGKIPNPLIGEGTLSTGEKVRVEQDDDGKMSIRLIPPKIASSDGRSFKIQVDAKDENTIPQIQTKILKRNNIDPSMSQLVSERQVVNIDHPEVKMQFTIDLEEYILGLLKIAYEFTVDKIEGYIDDPIAIRYASILHDGDVNRLSEVFIEGDAIANGGLKILDSIIDNSNTNRHILLLLNLEGKLYCIVKLFDKFCQIIKMSDCNYGEDGMVLIAINDFLKKECRLYNPIDLIKATKYSEYTTFKFSTEAQAYLDKQKNNEKIGFVCNFERDNLLFDCHKNILCTESMLLLMLEKLNHVKDSIYKSNEISVIYTIPPGYYYLCAPEDVLLMVEEITKVTVFQKI